MQKHDVKPSAIFLGQIDRFHGRQEEKEDPLVGFHKPLQERKLRALSESKESRDSEEEDIIY